MNPLRRIVAATDFSENAGYALARAALIAEEHGAELSLAHILNASTLHAMKTVLSEQPSVERDLMAASQHALAEMAAGAAGSRGISVTTTVRVGSVIEELLAEARSADLLALGVHGLNPVRDRILGTTAERIIGKCPTPILVTRRLVTSAYERLLVPVDLSTDCVPILRAAHRMGPRASIHVLHVYDLPFEGKLWLAGVARETIEKHREEARVQSLKQIHALIDAHLPDRHVSVIVERGAAAFSILENASRHDADLVVIGKRSNSAIADFFLGSVTRHVLSDVDCDVLVMPPSVE
jgi:nucleotide-binding universal stress UspA family protein